MRIFPVEFFRVLLAEWDRYSYGPILVSGVMPLDIYADVTTRVLEALETGVIPWVRPWANVGAQRNLESGREYSGINTFLLNITSATHNHASPYWLTFNQCKARGGCVKAGEKATRIVFWKIFERPHPNNSAEILRIPVLRHYNVFNTEQCTLPPDSVPVPEVTLGAAPEASAEAVWANYAGAPSLRFGGDSALYSPGIDVIVLPRRMHFLHQTGYYHTLFHEAIHSTGHPARLNRATLTQAGKFGDANYSQEELVAELGASMLLSKADMTPDIQNAAAYIQGWLAALRHDKRLVLVAAQQAQKAANHIAPQPPANNPAPEAILVEA